MQPALYTHDDCVRNSEKVAWTLAEVLGDESFDHSRRFLPESLAQVNAIESLTANERLILNQIRGLTYAHIFGFVEEYILRKVVQLAAERGPDDTSARRALLRFADEEVKHQQLFERTKAALLKKLGDCQLVGGASEVASVILQKSEMTVLLLTAMLEWVTQQHYTEMIRPGEERESLDGTFVRIFKSHWLEEAQHAKIDYLELSRVSAKSSQADRDQAVDGLLEIGGAFDGIIKQQAENDLASLERLSGRTFGAEERKDILTRQHRAYRYTFLVSGLTHPTFVELLASFSPSGAAKVSGAATALSA